MREGQRHGVAAVMTQRRQGPLRRGACGGPAPAQAVAHVVLRRTHSGPSAAVLDEAARGALAGGVRAARGADPLAISNSGLSRKCPQTARGSSGGVLPWPVYTPSSSEAFSSSSCGRRPPKGAHTVSLRLGAGWSGPDPSHKYVAERA